MGLLVKSKSPADRRSVIVKPLVTDKQLEKKLGESMVSYRSAMAKLFRRYNADQTAVIVDFLQEFVQVLKAQTSKVQDIGH